MKLCNRVMILFLVSNALYSSTSSNTPLASLPQFYYNIIPQAELVNSSLSSSSLNNFLNKENRKRRNGANSESSDSQETISSRLDNLEKFVKNANKRIYVLEKKESEFCEQIRQLMNDFAKMKKQFSEVVTQRDYQSLLLRIDRNNKEFCDLKAEILRLKDQKEKAENISPEKEVVVPEYNSSLVLGLARKETSMPYRQKEKVEDKKSLSSESYSSLLVVKIRNAIPRSLERKEESHKEKLLLRVASSSSLLAIKKGKESVTRFEEK